MSEVSISRNMDMVSHTGRVLLCGIEVNLRRRCPTGQRRRKSQLDRTSLRRRPVPAPGMKLCGLRVGPDWERRRVDPHG